MMCVYLCGYVVVLSLSLSTQPALSQGPDLSIGVPSLDFNLVQVGKRSTLALPIRNDSCVPAQFAVSCTSQDTGDACLTVSVCSTWLCIDLQYMQRLFLL